MDYYIEVIIDEDLEKEPSFLNKLLANLEKKPEKIVYVKPYQKASYVTYKPILLIYNKEIEAEIKNLKQKHNL